MSRWPTKLLGEFVQERTERLGQAPATIYSVTNEKGFVRSLDLFDKQVFSKDTANYKRIEFSDLAYNPSRINVGSIAMCDDKSGGAVSPMYVIVRCKPGLLPRFLLYFLKSGTGLHQIRQRCEGAVRFQLKFRDLCAIPILAPPSAEQERIARLLDEVDELRRLRAQADRRTADLIPALFHEKFGDLKSRSWKEYCLGDTAILEIIDGDRGKNYPKKTDFSEDGYCLFLNTSNVRKGAFDFTKCDFIRREKDNELRKGKLTRGDVVLTTRGTLGNSTHYDSKIKYENVRINSGMVILRANPTLLIPEYLLVILNSREFESQVETMTSGSAQQQLPINRLSRIRFVLPPLPIQEEFANRVAEIHELESAQAASRNRLDALFQSMLHRAFRGEL